MNWGNKNFPRCLYVDINSVRLLRSVVQSAVIKAWRDRDTNDIFAHCSLNFYFLDFKFSNFVCPSELHPFIWFFLKIPSGKRKISEKPPKTRFLLETGIAGHERLFLAK